MDAVGTDSDVDYQAVEKLSDISTKDLALTLRSPEVRRVFLKTALLLAWADGTYSDKERAWIREAAAAFGIGEKDLAREDELVRTFLLSQLSDLENVEAAKEVAKKLGF
jgi:tellurite resistance protein